MRLSKRMICLASVLLLSVISAPSLLAADPKLVDAQIAKLASKIEQIKSGNSEDFEKLAAANKDLLKYLKTVSRDPSLMTDPLKKASDQGLSVLTSADKKLRLYSWDTLTGGTMHIFYSLMVYDAGDKQMKINVLNPESKDEDGAGSSFEGLDTIKTKDGKTVYLVQDLSIGSSIIRGRCIQAFVIANGKLTKYPFFQTPKKVLDSISYSFGGNGDETDIELSKDKQTLRIPIIKDDPAGYSGGDATGKFLTYRFIGNRFVFKKCRTMGKIEKP